MPCLIYAKATERTRTVDLRFTKPLHFADGALESTILEGCCTGVVPLHGRPQLAAEAIGAVFGSDFPTEVKAYLLELIEAAASAFRQETTVNDATR